KDAVAERHGLIAANDEPAGIAAADFDCLGLRQDLGEFNRCDAAAGYGGLDRSLVHLRAVHLDFDPGILEQLPAKDASRAQNDRSYHGSRSASANDGAG